jgi:hypothetical protein
MPSFAKMPIVAMQNLESRLLFAAQKILFIRGASGTGGFLDGGTLAQRDEELADINNLSTAKGNHGWGELANLLRSDGFTLEQRIEKNDNRVDLTKLDLSQYSTIVFGSNNADYTPHGDKTIVKALVNYVFAGGSALFASDANFGTSYGDAPSSDQEFLGRFGLAVNQDKGTYSLTRAANFRAPAHPILAGVNEIDGEGVSPGVRVAPVAGVTPQVIIGAKDITRNNDSFAKGTDRAVTDSDGALVVATAGLGRVAVAFDRNTFFNKNGAGTDLHRFDNTRYATNLFEWLAGRTPARPQVQAEDFQFDASPRTLRISFSRYVGRSISTDDVRLINRRTGKVFSAKSVVFEESTRTAFFNFDRSFTPDNYRATLFASGVTDSKGKHLIEDVAYDFDVPS